MVQAFGVLVAAGLILALELPALRKKKLRKELYAFLILLVIGTGLNLAEVLQIELPNPLDLFEPILRPIGEPLYQLFHTKT